MFDGHLAETGCSAETGYLVETGWIHGDVGGFVIVGITLARTLDCVEIKRS